jgi:hypothetical protein
MRSISLFAVITTLLISCAGATTIPVQLCGTGTTLGCSGLNPLAGSPDLNYLLAAVPASQATTGFGYVSADSGFPLPSPWVANGPNSKWITPTQNQGDSVVGGEYDYTTTFTLPSIFYQPIITGAWATDNSGVAILLNGHDIGASIAYGPAPYGFGSLSPFSATDASWFVSGTNTLTFEVFNGNGGSDTTGPSGLRVDINSATYSTVPEPATFGLILAGLPVAWWLKRKRA